MGIILPDPLIHNVAILSEQQSLIDVEKDYIADPFGRWLVPRVSFLGRVIAWFYFIFEYLGWCYAQTNMSAVINTAQLGLAQLRRSLQESSSELLSPVSPFLSLSFDERWQRRIQKVDRLFGGENFPSFEKTQRVAAPLIIQEITRSPIPWKAFECILHRRPLDSVAEQNLKQWIEDVKIWGTFISPTLLLSVCEAAASRSFAGESKGRLASCAFFLAWTLYKEGLAILSAPDLDESDLQQAMIATSTGTEEVVFGDRIPLRIPSEFPIAAKTVQNYPNLMVLTSSSPLLLGMWMHTINEYQSMIPVVHPVSCDCRGRYVIVERLTSSVAEVAWEGKGYASTHDAQLLGKLVAIGEKLMSVPSTLDLSVDQLFVTSELEIRTMSPIQQRLPFFCLPLLERFFREACHQDLARVKYLIHHSGLRNHRAAQMYRFLLKNFGFAATDPDIHRTLRAFDLNDQNFLSVVEWLGTLRNHALYIAEQVKNVPSFSSLVPEAQMVKIRNAFLRTQIEIGWISVMPPVIPQYIIHRITKGTI
jgi:hypothetical protein